MLQFQKFFKKRWIDFDLNLVLVHPALAGIELSMLIEATFTLLDGVLNNRCSGLTKSLNEANDNVTTVVLLQINEIKVQLG